MRPLSTDANADAGPVTPASLRFDPFEPAYVEDPFPTLAQLRSEEPVFYSPSIRCWVVTRHETVMKVLRDPARFSALIASDPLTPLCPHARQMIAESGFNVPPMLVNNDPPSHTRYRAFFGAPLTRGRFESLAPFIRETVEAHIDRLTQRGSPADLVAGMTWDVPAYALLELLGVPREDVPRVKEYAESRVVFLWGKPTESEQARLAQGAIEFYRYAMELVQSKLDQPGDDYVSDLLRLRAGDDEKATLHEIGALVFNLLFAGHETTSSAAANLFKVLLADRALWARVASGEQPLAPVVEEGLRFDPPVQGWRRRAKEDVELDGVHIPAGSPMLLMFAAANRDPAQFADPDAFCPQRPGVARHLAFGSGLHFCLGAPLAKLEVSIMVERIAARLPDIELVPGQHFSYTPNTSFRSLRRLMVQWPAAGTGETA